MRETKRRRQFTNVDFRKLSCSNSVGIYNGLTIVAYMDKPSRITKCVTSTISYRIQSSLCFLQTESPERLHRKLETQNAH